MALVKRDFTVPSFILSFYRWLSGKQNWKKIPVLRETIVTRRLPESTAFFSLKEIGLKSEVLNDKTVKVRAFVSNSRHPYISDIRDAR